MINKISSKESSLFKYAKKLISKSNFRKREKKFIVEGFREIQHCKNSNFTIDQIFVLKDKLQSLSIKDLKINLITRELIEQIIYRESEGIFAIVNYKTSKIKLELLAPIAALLLEKKNENTSLTANSLSTILGGVSSRLDENRDIIRYIIGLLVFLGLLGTFWGLLQTISSVSSVIQSLEISVNENNANFFDKIIKGLNAPMEGMSTAFSSSLFGLGTSLILGFLDLQVSQANNRFFNELEDWLSQKAIFTAPSETKNIELGEVALENLAVISKNYINTENEKVKTSERLNELNLLLSRLTEKLDDEKNIKHSI